MIKRIVKMTFQADKVEEFLTVFESSKQHIRDFPGVQHLELLRSTPNDHILFTFSIWESEEALENYRHSDLFKSTWAKTKPLFASKAEAWSTQSLQLLA